MVDLLHEHLSGPKAGLVDGDPDAPGVRVDIRTAADNQMLALAPGLLIPRCPPRLDRDIRRSNGCLVVENHHDVAHEPVHLLHRPNQGSEGFRVVCPTDDRHPGAPGHTLESRHLLLPGRPDPIELRHALDVVAGRVTIRRFELLGIGGPCLGLAGVTANMPLVGAGANVGIPVVLGRGTPAFADLGGEFRIVSLNLSPQACRDLLSQSSILGGQALSLPAMEDAGRE